MQGATLGRRQGLSVVESLPCHRPCVDGGQFPVTTPPVHLLGPIGMSRFDMCRGRHGPTCRDSQPDSYLVDPASSHMLVSKIKPCMSKYKQSIQ
jgi:hypothetical protein